MNLEELKNNYSEKILTISKKNKFKTISVFGSVVKGNSNPNSDIDFLVELEDGADAFDLGGLYNDLENLLGKVDVVTVNGLNKHIKAAVISEAIAL